MTPALDKLSSVATIPVGSVSSWRLAPAAPVAAGSLIALIKSPSTEHWGLISLKKSLWESGGAIYAAGRPFNCAALAS